MDKGTYDGDDVSMFVLASVAFLFPLHDGGRDAANLVEVKERAAVSGARRVSSKEVGDMLYRQAGGTWLVALAQVPR